MKNYVVAASAALLFACTIPRIDKEATPTVSVASVVGEAELRSGLFDLWVDDRAGKVWVALPLSATEPIAECLFLTGLSGGLGSNPVGLDRGKLGSASLVRFRQVGQRVFMEQPNLGFRANDAEAAEQRATSESFATSVLWSAPIAAQSGESILVELTPLLLQDRFGVGATLKGAGQGNGWSVDVERSGLLGEQVLAFPDNLEFDALLTFAGGAGGAEVNSVTPDPTSISLVQHLSFVRLPEEGYQPRRHDPRMGAGSIAWQNYAGDLAQPVGERRVNRHRLQSGDSLVYYLDPGAPEPIRSALLDGARWWDEAFTAAGYPGAFRVELLPADAHPLDVRYNVIQWVHRSTRGWSYGNSIVDPRTGEILKGHVSLGSLRVRQDRMIFEGLLGAGGSGKGGERDPVELALARIRQLSAHEVGHTLGLSHNFAASTYGGRASVMDYPAPLVSVAADGELDVSRAYGVGLGEWDMHAIGMLYGEPSAGQSEEEFLGAMLARVGRHDLRFSTDQDARSPGSAQPFAALWDNGSDAPRMLDQTLAVRAQALSRFGLDRLPAGWPVGSLQEVFVPIYLYHRYQIEAAAKWIGGVDYDPAARESTDPVQRAMAPDDQRRALTSLLATLEPRALDIAEETLGLLLPAAPSGIGRRERFRGRTDQTFDALGAAANAAEMTLTSLTQPARAARLVDQKRRDSAQLGWSEVLEEVSSQLFAAPAEGPRLRGVREMLRSLYVDRLIALADGNAPARVVEAVEDHLFALVHGAGTDLAAGALRRRMVRFLERSAAQGLPPARPAEPPPGSPIGADSGISWLGACSHGPW